MSMRTEFVLELPAPLAAVHMQTPPGAVLRHPVPEEAESLAEVMLDSFRGSVDDEGETTDDALVAAETWYAGGHGEPLVDCSWVLDTSGTILSACLVTIWNDEPLIAWIMTRGPWKMRGLASYLLRQSLLSLQDRGYSRVHAYVTPGNTSSEKLFAHFSFTKA